MLWALSLACSAVLSFGVVAPAGLHGLGLNTREL